MAIEHTGPGGVSNSYGVRTTTSKVVYENDNTYQDVFIPTGSVPIVTNLQSGDYACSVGVRTWTGVIGSAILTLTPGAGGTAYIEATEDGTTWIVWSEGVVSSETTARLAGPVVGLRVTSTVSDSSLGVVS